MGNTRWRGRLRARTDRPRCPRPRRSRGARAAGRRSMLSRRPRGDSVPNSRSVSRALTTTTGGAPGPSRRSNVRPASSSHACRREVVLGHGVQVGAFAAGVGRAVVDADRRPTTSPRCCSRAACVNSLPTRCQARPPAVRARSRNTSAASPRCAPQTSASAWTSEHARAIETNRRGQEPMQVEREHAGADDQRQATRRPAPRRAARPSAVRRRWRRPSAALPAGRRRPRRAARTSPCRRSSTSAIVSASPPAAASVQNVGVLSTVMRLSVVDSSRTSAWLPQIAEQHAKHGARRGQQQPFGQHLAEQASASRANRAAQRQLVAAGQRPAEHHVGDGAAANRQQQATSAVSSHSGCSNRRRTREKPVSASISFVGASDSRIRSLAGSVIGVEVSSTRGHVAWRAASASASVSVIPDAPHDVQPGLVRPPRGFPRPRAAGAPPA